MRRPRHDQKLKDSWYSRPGDTPSAPTIVAAASMYDCGPHMYTCMMLTSSEAH